MADVGDDTQAAVAGQAAHVSEDVTDEAVPDEAVSAVHAQPLPTADVPQVDAVSYLSDDRSCEGATHRFLTSGLLGMWLFLSAPHERFLGAGMWCRGLESGSEPHNSSKRGTSDWRAWP